MSFYLSFQFALITKKHIVFQAFINFNDIERELIYAFGEDSVMSPITLDSTLKSVGRERSKRSTLVTTAARIVKSQMIL